MRFLECLCLYIHITHAECPSEGILNKLKLQTNSDEELFLLKKSELTALLIQHNQSPDASIFTLFSNNGSKVEKELEREKREREISEETIIPRNGKWRRIKGR